MSNSPSPMKVFELLKKFEAMVMDKKSYSNGQIKNTFYRLLLYFNFTDMEDFETVIKLIKEWLCEYRPEVKQRISQELIFETGTEKDMSNA